MDHITPAIESSDEDLDKLSTEDFQKMLSDWFEEKGVMTSLQCHLRMIMFGILKDTTLGNFKQTHRSASLSRQALNIVLAEYLLKNSWFYSLSIFTSEAGLNNIFPEQNALFRSGRLNNEYSRTWEMDKENLMNVLELIGLPKNSKEFKRLVETYYKYPDVPLLSCIFDAYTKRAMMMADLQSKIELEKCLSENGFMKSVAKFLWNTNLSEIVVEDLLYNLNKLYLDDKRNNEEGYKKKIIFLDKEVRFRNSKIEECHKNIRDLKSMILEMEEANRMLLEKVPKINESIQCGPFEDKIFENTAVMTDPLEIDCKSEHCNNTCKRALSLVNQLKEDNQRLENHNVLLKSELEKIDSKYKELVEVFDSFKATFGLVGVQIKTDCVLKEDKMIGQGSESLDSSSVSENYSEEIVKKAKFKLKQLEEESREIDLKFQKMFS